MALHQTHRAAKCMAMWRKKKKQLQGIKNNNNINDKGIILNVSRVRGKRK